MTIRPGVAPRTATYFLPQASKRPEYLLTFAGLFPMLWSTFTPYFYLTTFAQDHGMSTDMAFYLLTIPSAGGFVGRIVSDSLAVVVGPHEVLSASCMVFGVLTFCWLRTTSNASLIILAALFGSFSGEIFALFPVALAHIAPRPNEIGSTSAWLLDCAVLLL
jgi:predicted MFS family arabinose efflux permease